MYQQIEKKFNERWGWLLIAKSVSEWTGETFFQTMDRNLYEVLTIATLLKEQVEIIQNKTQNI